MVIGGQVHNRRILSWPTVVGIAIAGIAVWLLVDRLEWQATVDALHRANYRWVAVAILAIVGTFFVRTRRWQTLLWQSNVRVRPAMTALLVGQALNLALPLRSGDVVRAVWIGGQPDTDTTQALGSIAIEKVWDLVALAAVGIIMLLMWPLPEWFTTSTAGTTLIVVVVTGTLWFGVQRRDAFLGHIDRLAGYLPAGPNATVLKHANRFADGLESVGRLDISWRVFVWTVLTWALGAAANLAVLIAFGVPSLVAALFLLAALMAGGAVPVPARLGIFEGVTVVSLGLFGIPGDHALAIGLVLHLVVMGPPLMAAAALILWPAPQFRDTHA